MTPIGLKLEIPDATVQADIDETMREIRVMKTRIDYLQEQIVEREAFVGKLDLDFISSPTLCRQGPANDLAGSGE
jgi:hypothetical protein